MNASGRDRNKRSKTKRKTPHLLPALVAVGGVCGMAAWPASALELGAVQVNSALGQPLRASIAYALNPNEQIHAYCIYLRTSMPGSDARAFGDARISVSNNVIRVASSVAMREPVMNMQVVVDCAYTPHLSREYMLLIDPLAPTVTVGSQVASTRTVGAPQVRSKTAVTTESRPVAARTPGTRASFELSPVAVNTRYRVQPDDTVSTIVSRIENRTVGLWPAVEIVFAANPDAFMAGDINRLMAGTELFIPDLTGPSTTTPETAATSPAGTLSETIAITEPVVELPPASETPANSEPGITATIEDVQDTSVPVDAPVVADAPIASEPNSNLQPGDVVMPPVGSGGQQIIVPDTTIDRQPVAVPVVTAAKPATSGAWSWLVWLAGAGIALILGLLLFGRKIKDRFGSAGAATSAVPTKRRNSAADVDFEFEDTISAEAISLDADLGAGIGLNAGESIDVAEDFGFSANGQDENELDLEITEDAVREPEANPTDIIPPNHRAEPSSILESEEPPTDDDQEYDLSMIVDATKQPLDRFDATAKDLHAVQIDHADSNADDDDYEMSSAVDYQSLEQDYEDEFTATQAANAEIEKAAMELASRMEEEERVDVTREMPVADAASPELSDADSTEENPVQRDSDITAELATNLPTSGEAENDPEADTAESDVAIDMAAAGSDITVDMKIESGKVDTKKK